MNATSAYESLMDAQIDALDLKPGQRVVDLGAGTGSFPLRLARRMDRQCGLWIDEVDYVPEALARGRRRIAASGCGDLAVRFLVADLEGTRWLPLRAGAYDRVLASLLLSYLAEPERLLAEAYSILRPGGRLVVSTLRPDADVSKLFVDGLSELRAGRARDYFGVEEEKRVVESARLFLNDAARVLDFEEQGRFRFWDSVSFERLIRQAGFRDVEVQVSFGEPPQAIVLTARRD
jgi:ubiquinone/menaquinone biosynthesis C-methylase UbiE